MAWRGKRQGSGVQLHAVPCRLRTIPARRHVAPSSPPVLRLVLKDASAPRIGTAPDAGELSQNERVGGALHDRDEQTGEGIADGYERAREAAVAAQLDPAGAGTASEDAVDLTQRLGPDVPQCLATLREPAQHRAHSAGVAQHGERTRRLLQGAALHGTRALGVEDVGGLEPMHEAPEVVQGIDGPRPRVRIHEVEPETLGNERERVSLSMEMTCDGGGKLERGRH
jgi:hypothetical protein